MIAALVVFVIGLSLYFYSRKLDEPYEEYEFQNRTDGGVVEFESLAISKSHHRKRRFISYLGTLGILITLMGIYNIVTNIGF